MLESDCALYIDQGRLTCAVFIDLRKAVFDYRQPCQVLLEFGNSGYRGLPILEGNEILIIIIIHAAVITVDLKTVERATSHSDNDDNFYLKVLSSSFCRKNTERIKHICAY